MLKSFKSSLAIAAVATTAVAGAAEARDMIRIVGSSTVFPFASAVVEQFGKTTSFPTPVIESTGTGGGLKLFCAGTGTEHPDITNASARIKQSQLDSCTKNGIEPVEIMIGFDGIVLANKKGAFNFDLTKKQIFMALAAKVPADAEGKELIDNPNKKWSDIDPSLPNAPILVLGPPPTSGTRAAFQEIALEGGCKKFPAIKAMKKQDKKAYKKICRTVREDGAYVDAGENDNLIVSKLVQNETALGIFGFSFLDQNLDRLQGSKVSGVAPEFEQILSGDYGIARSLYFYIKKQHVGVTPGIEEYVDAFTQEAAFGDEGYLVDKGLIPLPAEKREEMRKRIKTLEPLKVL